MLPSVRLVSPERAAILLAPAGMTRKPAMDWRDEGILLSVRRHGETSAIIGALTAEHGRHAGLVRGGATRSRAALLQPGAQLSLEWRGRLETHLGAYNVDLVRARSGQILPDRLALAGLNAVSAMLTTLLPEREAVPELYAATLGLADAFGIDPRWPVLYAKWELALLATLGFGLSLDACAATGTHGELHYVSPRTGSAVCRRAAAPYADRLLPLPQFLIGRGAATAGDVRQALRLTGYFLKVWVLPALELPVLPAARQRLVDLLDAYDMPLAPIVEEEEDDDPAAWWYNRLPDPEY